MIFVLAAIFSFRLKVKNEFSSISLRKYKDLSRHVKTHLSYFLLIVVSAPLVGRLALICLVIFSWNE